MNSGRAPARTTRTGLVFFAIYYLAYTTFVFASAFAPSYYEHLILGVNLAVISGVALIVGAIVLSVMYCWVVRERV